MTCYKSLIICERIVEEIDGEEAAGEVEVESRGDDEREGEREEEDV